MKKIKWKYNWKPDLPDHRDFIFRQKIKVPLRIPKSVDLRNACSTVENQDSIGSCTGNALAGLLEFLEIKDLIDKDLIDPFVYIQNKFENVSRLFIYYNERVLENSVEQDSGATLRDGIRSLSIWGACREAIWPYDQKILFKRPTADAFKEAVNHKISSYYRIEGLRKMKECLALGYPFVFGFSVYESFESPRVAETGMMPIPKKSEEFLGGHAVMAVGYDDTKELLIVRNSWGEKWGLKGYFLMPYEIVENTNLSADFWTIREV
ncbi:MAG: C1 family peptidase [Bdellovibrio sp.]|nr:C1 family peptidase [Bdellovibrio sp.]